MMKIDTNKKLSGSSKVKGHSTKSVDKVAGGNSFSHLLKSGNAHALGGSSSIEYIQKTDSLFMIQEVREKNTNKKKLVMHGKILLESLEDLKIAIISGDISPKQLQNLAQQLNEKRPETSDNRLDEILNEIEMRVEIELAKLDFKS